MNKPLTAPLDPAIADRLLDLLSTDDLFRERFQRNPRGALHEIGYQPPKSPARMTACGSFPVAMPEALIDCKVERLASKEAIAAAREGIRAMLTRGLNQTVPDLNARGSSAHVFK